MIRYIKNILIGLDQLANTVLGGDPDETISSRAAKRPRVWFWGLIGRFLEWIDPGHLQRSKEDDEGDNAAF